MPRVDVPFIQQRGSNDCLIACIMMILEWAKTKYKDVAQFEYEELEKILGMNVSGTKFCDVT